MEDEQVVAQELEAKDEETLVEESASDAVTATPSEEDSSSPAPEDKKTRNQRAREGRERAAYAARINEANSRIVQLESIVGRLVAQQTQAEQEAQERALAALPPAERAEARVRLLEQRLEQGQQQARPAAPPVGDETPEQRMHRMSQEMIDQANEFFGLSGTDLEITPEDDELDWREAVPFGASVRALGIARKKLLPRNTQEDGVANKPAAKTETKTPPASDEAKMAERIEQQVLAKLGVGGSLSAKAAAPGASPDKRQLDQIVLDRDSKQGPKATIAQLQAKRDEARAALTRKGS